MVLGPAKTFMHITRTGVTNVSRPQAGLCRLPARADVKTGPQLRASPGPGTGRAAQMLKGGEPVLLAKKNDHVASLGLHSCLSIPPPAFGIIGEGIAPYKALSLHILHLELLCRYRIRECRRKIATLQLICDLSHIFPIGFSTIQFMPVRIHQFRFLFVRVRRPFTAFASYLALLVPKQTLFFLLSLSRDA